MTLIPAQLLYLELGDMACERITAAITRAEIGNRPVKAILDPYNPVGSTRDVAFTTSMSNRWNTDPYSNLTSTGSSATVTGRRSSAAWQREHPLVRSYVKNHGLGLKSRIGWGQRHVPTSPTSWCWLTTDTGTTISCTSLLRSRDTEARTLRRRKSTMDTYWVPGVNHLGTFGRWAFAEFTDVYEINAEFEESCCGILACKRRGWPNETSVLTLLPPASM